MIKRLKRFLANVASVIKLPEISILPGQLAFFFVLSVVPIIILISYGASFFNLSTDFIKNFVIRAFSSDLANLIVPTVSGVKVGFSFFISLAVGFFIASNGADSIIVTSNTIYNIKDSTYIRRRIKALIMTMLIVILFLFILVFPVFGRKITDLIAFVNLNETVTNNIAAITNLLSGPISWLVMFFFIKIIYTMAPDRKVSSSTVTYGSLFTSICWILMTLVYSYYINHYAHYDVFYGGLANIVVLMLWVYFLAYIFVIGMALNYQEEEFTKTQELKAITSEDLKVKGE